MFKNLISKVKDYIRFGMTPQEAVDKIAEMYGLYKDGNIYEYLLKRAEEEIAK